MGWNLAQGLACSLASAFIGGFGAGPGTELALSIEGVPASTMGGATRSLVVEAEGRLAIFSWLSAEAGLTLTRACLVDAAPGEDEIALAPRLTISFTAEHPIGLFARLGVLHLRDHPVNGDGFISARGFTDTDLTLGYESDALEITIDVENLLDAGTSARVSVSLFF